MGSVDRESRVPRLMHTQCPQCHTVFRVTEEILAVKAGLVRCGDCENVFNATWNLVEEDALAGEIEDDRTFEDAEQTPTAAGGAPSDAQGDRHTFDKDTSAPPSEAYSDVPDAVPGPRRGRHPWAPDYDEFDDDAYDDPAPDSTPEGTDDTQPGFPSSSARAEVFDDDEPEPGAEEMGDDEIRRTLRLDESLYDDSETDQPRAPAPRPPVDTPGPGPAERPRVEPTLGPPSRRDLSVSADDRLLPRRHKPVPPKRERSPLTRRPAIPLKAPHREQAAPAVASEPPPAAPRSDPNVHWVSIPNQHGRGSGLLWASGVLLAIVLIVLQIRYLLVDELYAIESTRPYISLFCEFAGCQAPVRSDPVQIDIAQTRVDLHPEVPGALRVKVNLINRAPFPQPYPGLTLTLSDKDGRIVGRRTYSPQEYLEDPGRSMLDPGLLAIATINLAHPNENAVGFETRVAGGRTR